MAEPRASIATMGATNLLLAQLMTLAGLIGGTVEYCEILKRRGAARRSEQERLASQASGLHALVRVFIAQR
jgi:hypothetical protein